MTTEANAPITPDTPATLGDLNMMAEAIMTELGAVESRLTEQIDGVEQSLAELKDSLTRRMDGIEQTLAEIKDALAR